MDNNYGESFLNRLYKDLHMSDEVMHTALPSDTKDEKVSKYLSRLEKVEELAKNSKYNGLELLKELYYKKYVIKPENVPESYFELQKKIALERGYGHVQIYGNQKKQMIDTIIDDQKKSLDTWLDYLMSDDIIYPEWFKYYAFQGMIKLGSYDKEKASFNKRTDSTTSVFIDLNREALALVYDNLYSSLQGNKVDDELLQKLLDSGSFSKLYSYMLNKLESANKDLNSNEGIWIKYNQGDNPDDLVKSLEGKGTGWCTTGIETARSQLKGGDFYVYYTKDSNGEYKQPRIAIRMDGSSIAEIRGIASSQNIEPEMEEVVEEKLQEFPDKDKYKKKVSDMKILTEIYNNYKTRELTLEELRFLYEIDNVIDSFGYEEDPRIETILRKRYFKDDLARVFDCSVDEVSNNESDILAGKKIVCFYGGLYFRGLPNDLVLPEYVCGDLECMDCFRIGDLKLPNAVYGDLYLGELESVEGLKLPNYIRGSLNLGSLINAEGLKLPNEVYGSLDLSNIKSAEGLNLPSKVCGDFNLKNIENAEGLKLPNYIGGSLYLNSLTVAKNLELPENVHGDLYLNKLTDAEGLTFPKMVGGILFLPNLSFAKGIKLPTIVSDDLIFHSLTYAEDVVFPVSVGKDLVLERLVNAKNVILSDTVGGNLYLSSLKCADGLTLPTNISGNRFELYSLSNLDGIIVPKDFKFGGFLDADFPKQALFDKALENDKISFKQRGFSKISILIVVNILIIIGIIFLGCWFMT